MAEFLNPFMNNSDKMTLEAYPGFRLVKARRSYSSLYCLPMLRPHWLKVLLDIADEERVHAGSLFIANLLRIKPVPGGETRGGDAEELYQEKTVEENFQCGPLETEGGREW